MKVFATDFLRGCYVEGGMKNRDFRPTQVGPTYKVNILC